MFYYLLKLIICSGILYGYYHFFLRNEKFHQYNRFYLLGSVLFSIIVPMIKIPIFFKHEEENNPIQYLISTGENVIVSSIKQFDWSSLLYAIAVVIVGLMLLRLMLTIIKILNIKKEADAEKIGQIHLYKTSHPDAPFSFFNWLFWHRQTKVESKEGQQIFKHEWYHISRKHSWDLLFIEFTICLFWFNPFFYLYRKEIKTIQEFLADKYATQNGDALDYAEMLVLQIIKHKHNHLINPFFHHQIKRRIIMLTMSKKPQYQWLRKLLILPLTVAVFMLFAFTYKKTNPESLSEFIPSVNKSILDTTEHFNKYILNNRPISKGEFEKIPAKLIDNLAVMSENGETTTTINLKSKAQFPIDTTPKKEIRKSNNDIHPTDPVETQSMDVVTVTGFREENFDVPETPEVYTKVEVSASYPGGSSVWKNFLERNLNGQIPIIKGAKPGIYHTYIQFVVDKEGNVSNLIPLSKNGYGMEEEAMRVIQKSGMWRPAVFNGQKVVSYRKQPIVFQVFSINSNSGTVNVNWNQKKPDVFTKVELDPKYPGNWSNFLNRNLVSSIPVENGASKGNYTVLVQFIVDIEGNTKDFRALTQKGFGMEEEAIRVLKRSGKWTPAVQNGRSVNAYKIQPITFQIDDK